MDIEIDEQTISDKYKEDVSLSPSDIKTELMAWIQTLEQHRREDRLTRFLLNKFQEAEKDGAIVQTIYVSPSIFAIIRTMGKSFFDEESSSEKISQGIFGYLWTATVVVKSDLDKMIISTEIYGENYGDKMGRKLEERKKIKVEKNNGR